MFEGMWGRERRQPAHYTKNYSCCAAPGMKCAEITVIPENFVAVSAKHQGCPQSACSLASVMTTVHRDYGFMRPAFQLFSMPFNSLSPAFRRGEIRRQCGCFRR